MSNWHIFLVGWLFLVMCLFLGGIHFYREQYHSLISDGMGVLWSALIVVLSRHLAKRDGWGRSYF